MNQSSPEEEPTLKVARIFWVGLILLAVGCLPYVIFNLLAANKVFAPADFAQLGRLLFVLASLAFLPGVICMNWGAGVSMFRHMQAQKWHKNPASRPQAPAADVRPRFKLPVGFWAGLIALVGCSGPLMVSMLLARLGLMSESDPNTVIFGIMAVLTFWPSVVCMLGGVISAYVKHQNAKKVFARC